MFVLTDYFFNSVLFNHPSCRAWSWKLMNTKTSGRLVHQVVWICFGCPAQGARSPISLEEFKWFLSGMWIAILLAIAHWCIMNVCLKLFIGDAGCCCFQWHSSASFSPTRKRWRDWGQFLFVALIYPFCQVKRPHHKYMGLPSVKESIQSQCCNLAYVSSPSMLGPWPTRR